MIKTLLVLAALAIPASTLATEFAVDPAHSTLEFTVKHLMISKVNGKFKEFAGNFNFDEKDPSKDKANFSIQVASIDTGVEKRDAHLKSEDFFDVSKNPTITFVSKKITKAGKNKYKVEGDMTMKGKTNPETFTVEYNGSAEFMGSKRSSFSTTGTINRQKYGVSWNKPLEKGAGMVVGDDIAINMNVEAVEKKADEKKEEKK